MRDASLSLQGRRPLRVVLDSSLRVPAGAKILDGNAPTMMFTAPEASSARADALRSAGAEVLTVAALPSGLDLDAVLQRLAAAECNEVLVEAGATLAGAFVASGLVDEIVCYVAGTLLGDAARAMLKLPLLERMSDRREYRWVDVRKVGADLRLTPATSIGKRMFTGIIQGVGTVRSIEPRGGDVTIAFDTGKVPLDEVEIGGSIAVNGVCLTATRREPRMFTADVSRETLSLTTLGEWAPGSQVNIEKALQAGQSLGGHYVTGHVDGVGTVISRHDDARSVRVEFEVPQELARYVARKGSVCVDGVSLTVNGAAANRFDVNLVPHTLAMTILGGYRPGSRVNLEVDIIARYLERMLEASGR